MDLDEFSDDGLDDLPDNALQELENNAIQLTQGHRKGPSQQPESAYADAIWVEDDDLDTTEVTNDVGEPVGRPVVDNTLQQYSQQQHQHQESRRSIPPLPNPRWDPIVHPSKRQPAGQPPPRMPGAAATNQPLYTSQQFQSQTSNLHRPQASQFARPGLAPNHYIPSQSQPGDVVSALQQRLRALETELNAARGEVSIIRTNSSKAQQQHDAEVARLKKLNAEQLSRQERIAEAAVVAEKNANTELQFLQRDMKEVNDRTRRKDTAVATGSGLTTPKKTSKTWRVADGFDEMDIVLSPSKGQGRNKNAGSVAANVGERTPSKGKRKRPALDSPIMALETHMDDIQVIDKEPEPSTVQPPIVIAAPPSLPFEFLQLVLDHGSFLDQPPTFEVLSRFSFSSEPNTSFAAYIFKKVPVMGNPQRPIQLLVDFVHLVVQIWTRCADEQYWEPIKYLVALIAFTFQLQATEVAPWILPDLAPVAQATICTLAEWRHRFPDEDRVKDERFKLLEEHINITDILSLLYTTSLTCATAIMETETGFESKAAHFWRHISLDTPLMLLTPKQELADILGMLDLLATSSLPSSIGPITDEKDPPFVARMIIDKVATRLTEYPRSATTPAEKRSVRLAALRTLIAFARYPFGAIQLASHSTALARLVICLSSSIDELYDQPIPSSILPNLSSEGESETRSASDSSSELYRIISQCVHLIHVLVTGPHTANLADITQKLTSAHGGNQRYLLALGRLAFVEEDLVMESGIDEDTIEAAAELLEMAVTPDEGEVVSEAFVM
ncbi:hypothetical protein BGZ61DRAFT_533081 [Ilyonectria robusta]|uniref:uncharacterized protein n=1 Tax=Ilyonectria robusta TaxID=1079257 RepID=UPI001E8CD858|nr:uncharacterized protein BGZ61DRAFT_533081 [Ilyonectria robusta]KAH8688291.1 hypothetical protein BGZ61DRAFT_533081 [Ilyonectria robusta]